MTEPVRLDHHQLEQLDKASLINLLLTLQEQLAAQGVLISRPFTVPLLAYPLHRSKSMAW